MRHFLTLTGINPITTTPRLTFSNMCVSEPTRQKLNKEQFELLLDHHNCIFIDTGVSASDIAIAYKIPLISTAAYLHDITDTLDMMADKKRSLLVSHIKQDLSTNYPLYVVHMYIVEASFLNSLVRPVIIDRFLSENK